MTIALLGALGPPRHRLPRRAVPFRFETVESYVDRLADLNHTPARDMRHYLAGAHQQPPRPDWLATASGYPVEALQDRLIGLDSDGPSPQYRSKISRPACRLCMARRNVYVPVMLIQPGTVCHRHCRWVGPGAQTWGDQVRLDNRPEVIRAARTHYHLVRAYTDNDVNWALRDAHRILVRGQRWRYHRPAATVDEQLRRYPDTIGLAALVAAHRAAVWEASIGIHDRGAARINLLGQVYLLGFPDDVADSVLVWADDQVYLARRSIRHRR